MSIYFDFKTIYELTGDNYYRQLKEFTLEDLSKYNGNNGSPAYVAIEGIVYDISNTAVRSGATHFGLTAGQDLTSQFNYCHGIVDILTNAPNVGILIDDDYISDMNFESNMITNRQIKPDTSKFTPDDWIRYITPLVTYALREPTQGMNTQRAYQKFILLGVLVGLGKTPQEAINQVQEWQNTGASQLLKTGTSPGTSGSIGTGVTGTGGSSGMGLEGSQSTSADMNLGGGAGTSGSNMSTTRQVKQDTSKFTPDDWISYITPLVTYALREPTQGMNTQRAYQKFILLGVLVGLGKTPQEAINQVQEWQNTDASQLLKSTTNAGTSGNIGTGVTGGSSGMAMGGSTGTSGNTNKSNKLYFD